MVEAALAKQNDATKEEHPAEAMEDFDQEQGEEEIGDEAASDPETPEVDG